MATHVVQSDSARPGELLNSLTLVSNSPQRAKLLREAGYRFQVVPPRLNEPQDISANRSAAQHAQALAYYKARSVADELPDRLLLGADTIVAVGDEILGKPADIDHARQILTTLSGRAHRVFSGLCVWPPEGPPVVRVAVTVLTMQRLSDEELDTYLEGHAWEGKAGAFGYQDGLDWVRIDQGSESNVIGLPLELLAEMLADIS